MPQVRCPVCGTNINLESRRETDFRMIVSLLEKKPKTFTELLRATKLPRKTLSLRLKELCEAGIIVRDKGYHLNGSPPPHLRGKVLNVGGNGGKHMFVFNKKALLLLLVICIGIPLSGYVYANYAPKIVISVGEEKPKIQYYGTLTIEVKIENVTDLFAWQARINYDTGILEFREITRGDFFGDTIPHILNSTDTFANLEDDLLVGDSLMGIDVTGVNGSGTLGVITFAIKAPGKTLEYFKENPPEIVFEPTIVPKFRTYLLNSEQQEILGAESMLFLEVVDVSS